MLRRAKSAGSVPATPEEPVTVTPTPPTPTPLIPTGTVCTVPDPRTLTVGISAMVTSLRSGVVVTYADLERVSNGSIYALMEHNI
jgi:hypothetical protein